MRRILITGASGMVGYAICRMAIEQNYHVTGLARQDRYVLPGMDFQNVDWNSAVMVDSILEHHQPDIVVHLAANTNHSECERDPESARKLHVDVSASLAAASLKIASRFIHISTEAVYGDLGQDLRKETDICKPEGVYATTKREGEIQVLRQHPEALILRVTPVGYAPNGLGRTLVEWLLGKLLAGESITGYTDVHFTPVSSVSLARLILDPRLEGLHGIYNWGNSEAMSKYRFACLFAASLGHQNGSIQPGVRTASCRSFQGGMDSSLLSELAGIPQPSTWELIESLKHNILPS